MNFPVPVLADKTQKPIGNATEARESTTRPDAANRTGHSDSRGGEKPSNPEDHNDLQFISEGLGYEFMDATHLTLPVIEDNL